MKNIQSTIEGTWYELVPVELTENEKTLLLSTKAEDANAKATLLSEIKTKREKSLSKTESEIAQSIYLIHKPELTSEDIYELISVDIFLEDTTGTGIINCRINGEHKQVRF